MSEQRQGNTDLPKLIGKPAPDWQVHQWLNTEGAAIRLADLKGKIVVVEAFQMLCPGCVSHGLPQAKSVQALLPSSELVVIGLHTVFEHHSANSPATLKAFLHEYRIDFPVAIDLPGKHGIPLTMQAYEMRGTPTMNIIDQSGVLRVQHFGIVSDLQLGYELATLRAQGLITREPCDEAMRQCNEEQCARDTH